MSSKGTGMLCALYTAPRTLKTTSPHVNGFAIAAYTSSRAVRNVHSTAYRAQSVCRAQQCPTPHSQRLQARRQLILPATISSQHFHTTSRSLSQPPVSSPSSVNYAIAAAFSAKHNRFSYTNTYRHTSAAAEAFKPGRREKKARPKSGEDSFFVSGVNSTGSTAFGVVDGVGGWTSSGVDPADFAHGLCEYMANAARTWPEWEEVDATANAEHVATVKAANPADLGELEALRPVELLQEGYDRVLGDRTIFAGGSTACLAIAAPSGRVEVANLGDSGLLHLSPHRITALTTPQTHAFNTPFQLSKLPPRLLVQQAIFGGGKPFSEVPANSDVSAHQLAPGDVLVLATDGVWDNLSAQDILAIVSSEMDAAGAWGVGDDGGSGVNKDLADLMRRRGSDEGLQVRVALAITKAAKEASLSRTRDGPFAKEVQRRYPQENWKGGKADDICVVVAVALDGRSASVSS